MIGQVFSAHDFQRAHALPQRPEAFTGSCRRVERWARTDVDLGCARGSFRKPLDRKTHVFGASRIPHDWNVEW